MRTVTDTARLQRRSLLAAAAGAVVVGATARAHAAGARAVRLLAAWDEPGANEPHRVGLIDIDARGRVTVRASIAVPTRAHGLVWEAASGSALAVARRPGDWLLRWRPGRAARAAQWHWSAPQRRFNGHVLRIGDRVLTSETDFDADGQGVVVLREAASLRELAVWPTHGRDPHALLWAGEGENLWVANGGIGTDLATGRSKDLRAMDSSLVRLDAAASGALRGQWRLDDVRLSLRHLARANDGSIGVALQAEHDLAAQRDAAPLLAVWKEGRLRAIDPEGACNGGYGGDIAARGERFFVSATRAGRLLAWSARDGWGRPAPLDDAGALALVDGALWCADTHGWASMDGTVATDAVRTAPRAGRRPDNHALGMPA